MTNKLTIDLAVPVAANDNCLPHAAMALGSIRGGGTRPRQAMVSRLVIQEQMGSWVLYRQDDCGGFVGDTWHPTRQDAIEEVKREFGVDVVSDE